LQIEVTARNASITNDMKEYAESKAERLIKYYDRVQSIRVVLDVEGVTSACEMIVKLEHMHDLVGTSKDQDMHAAIDQSVDRLERQLAELKDRIRNHKGRGPNPHQPSRS